MLSESFLERIVEDSGDEAAVVERPGRPPRRSPPVLAQSNMTPSVLDFTKVPSRVVADAEQSTHCDDDKGARRL
jgi:hypothetical protein